MKFSLSSKQTSKLSITPQLQSAIKLLQYSAVEINQEIQNIFETNPLIEKEDNCEDYQEDDCETHYAHYPDIFLSRSDNTVSTSEIIEKTSSEEESLKDHLLWQVHLLNISEKDKSLAKSLADYTNDDGHLIKEIYEIFDETCDPSEVTVDELIAVQHLMQNLDPVGTCTSNIQESLVVQIQSEKKLDSLKDKACIIINEFFEEYANKEFIKIQKNLNITSNDMKKIDDSIKKQNPRPGAQFFKTKKYDYIIPDIKIFKEDSNWVIKPNKLVSPDIKINENYVEISKDNISDDDKEYIKKNLQEAKVFIKNIKYRNETLLEISRGILKKQIDFFNNGIEKIKPMNLKEIAEIVNVHESTVSRLTNGKYMETPYGIFELKFFFSSSLNNNFGTNFSSKSITEKIKKIINSEDKSKPYSDDKITAILSKENINIARRTVAKYRESLKIESSSKRKTK